MGERVKVVGFEALRIQEVRVQSETFSGSRGHDSNVRLPYTERKLWVVLCSIWSYPTGGLLKSKE